MQKLFIENWYLAYSNSFHFIGRWELALNYQAYNLLPEQTI